MSYVPGIVLSSTFSILGASSHRPERLKQHCNADLHPLAAVAGSFQVDEVHSDVPPCSFATISMVSLVAGRGPGVDNLLKGRGE